MSKEKILKIKFHDGEVIYIEEDVNDINADIEGGMVIFRTKFKGELLCTPVGSIKYYRVINKEGKPVETQEEEKTCRNCKHENEGNWGDPECYTIVGDCIDYDKWEPEE